MLSDEGFGIIVFEGDRASLRDLFELADDSAMQIDATIDLGTILAARLGDAIVGIAHLVAADEPTSIEIRVLAVAEDHQNHGVGAALLDAAADAGRTSGHRALTLSTATADTDLLRFYQRRGFRLTHIEPDAFTPESGYPPGTVINGIPLCDRAWFRLDL